MFQFTWLAVPILVSLVFIVRAVLDLRAKRYVWAAICFASAVGLLAMPVPTQSFSVDLSPAVPATN